MDISVRRDGSSSVEDRRWLGDVDGTQATRSVTLVTALFDRTRHFPQGFVKSGTVLGQITADGETEGMWGPYDPAATDGRQTAKAFLFNTIVMAVGDGNKGAPAQERGFIRPKFLPANSGLDAAAREDLAAHFIFRD